MTLQPASYTDEVLYKEFVGLKAKKPSLKTFISVGGWDAGSLYFSAMAKDASKRKSFIKSTLIFLERYGFDGIDIDWEYPGAGDRGNYCFRQTLHDHRLIPCCDLGGWPEDYDNYVTLLKELKVALGKKYGLTIAIPASYCGPP